MTNKKSDTWNIEVIEKRLYTGVQFERELTRDQAIKAFYNEEYEEISDEETLGTIEVSEAEIS